MTGVDLSKIIMNITHPIPCVKKGHTHKVCWLTTLANGVGPETVKQDDILICNECVTFKETINRGFGRRTADVALGSTIAKLLRQVSDRNISLDEARQKLEKKVSELALMKIITDAVVRTKDLERALKIILTGVTSGRAFGFNRAGIFLVDSRNEYLRGMDAVGPENWQAAIRIWNELHSLSFEQQITAILKAPSLEKDYLSRVIEAVKVSLSDPSNFLIGALQAEKPTFFRKSEMDPQLAAGIQRHLEFNEFVAVPLKAEGIPLGLMVADNFYTNKPITEASIDALETLANTCTSVLEITLLHEQLSERLEELERVNRLLRENQAYLLQAERLADIGRLAATVAHEFKTPLVTIGAHARRTLRDINTPKFKRKDLDIIVSEVDRLEKITSQILEYSRPSKFDIKSYPINDLVGGSLDFLEHRLSALGIKLGVKYADQNPNVAVDEKRFKQVFFNIVDNALDAMCSGMALKIETRTAGEYAILDITDTGCGIPEEHRDRIFTFFFTTKAKGSGLGLPISRRIVEDHGGYIEFESKVDLGTTFSVYFPVTPRK
jgi:signal transduction histidine kinase